MGTQTKWIIGKTLLQIFLLTVATFLILVGEGVYNWTVLP